MFNFRRLVVLSKSFSTEACIAWTGTSTRILNHLDGKGGILTETETSITPPPQTRNPLWVHFPTIALEDVQSFNHHVQHFCVPSNQSFRNVLQNLNAAPPSYEDWIWKTDTAENTTTNQAKTSCTSTGVHLAFQTSLSSKQKIRIFATPSICMTQMTSNALDLTQINVDLNDGVGAATSVEIVINIIEALVTQNIDLAKGIDSGLGHVEEKVLTSETWRSSINDHVLKDLSSLRFRAVRQRRVLLSQMSVLHLFSSDVLASQPENDIEVTERRDLILANVTKNEIVRLNRAKQGFLTALEILDGVQDRSVFVSQEIAAKNSQKTNKLLTILSIITGSLVPLQMCVYYVEGINVGWLHWPV